MLWLKVYLYLSVLQDSAAVSGGEDGGSSTGGSPGRDTSNNSSLRSVFAAIPGTQSSNTAASVADAGVSFSTNSAKSADVVSQAGVRSGVCCHCNGVPPTARHARFAPLPNGEYAFIFVCGYCECRKREMKKKLLDVVCEGVTSPVYA